MAGSSLLVLLDDIAAVLDDVAAMTKVAARKTAGVLGDDLAVNAEKVTGVRAERELPVVWAVAKGSFLNKCILVPAALVTAFLAPWLITPVLILGGLYLCYEGFEKVAHRFFHHVPSQLRHKGNRPPYDRPWQEPKPQAEYHQRHAPHPSGRNVPTRRLHRSLCYPPPGPLPRKA